MPIPESSGVTGVGLIDPGRVRRLFAEPGKITESDFLRREIADRMRERLSLVKTSPRLVLDAGCGEGRDLSELQSMYSDANVIGIDSSYGMLRASPLRSGQSNRTRGLLDRWFGRREIPGFGLVCCDFSRLPLRAGSADMIWSNLALHWHYRPEQVFSEWIRVLKKEGVLMFSCFGPDTLQELRAAFERADDYSHVLPFTEMHDLGDRMVTAGFSSPVLDREVITVTYGNVEKLVADVRAFGGNALANRRRGLLGKEAWRRARQALEEGKNSEGRMSLSFEIIYGHAFRTDSGRTADGEAIVRFMRK